ncbi:MAG: hypothetical protein JXA73_14585 [Acidobacteria bacterium]|nr:hypothetical protein [Acidobacteriota bacterium]
MRDIGESIKEYCERHLPPEPIWISMLNRRFPKIGARMDGAESVQREFECHLRDSYEAHLAEGQNPEDAWKLAQERFGDVSVISQEIQRARAQSRRCMLIRFLAIAALFALPLGQIARIRIHAFFHPSLLLFMAVCAAVGFMITRKRDIDSLRRYAFYGSWLGLTWGIFYSLVCAKDPSKLGPGIAMIIMSTFYGLFLAAPKSRGPASILMMLLCHVGVLIPTARFGLLSFYPDGIDAGVLWMTAAFSLVSVLVGLTVFDIRKLHRRLAGVAAFSMVFAYIQILSNLTRPDASLLNLIFATSLPPLITVLIVLQIQKLQNCLLRNIMPIGVVNKYKSGSGRD